MTKIVLIGAYHAGTAAANTILDNYPDNELVIFDRNNNISYLGCGTALWVGRQIKGTDGLFYSSCAALQEKHAHVCMETEVTQVDFKNKIVHATGKEGNQIAEPYDKLIIATGSVPIMPQIKGLENDGVEVVKLFQDGQEIDALLDSRDMENVAVVGAGYIGVEIAEAVRRRGKATMLFETQDTCLSGYYDPRFTADMDQILENHGIELHYNEKVLEILGTGRVSGISTDKGDYCADMVILAIGFLPNTNLVKNDLKLFSNGAILVDKRQRTSMEDVFAVGDCATVWSNALQATAYIALATNAVRSGIVAAHNACGTEIESLGVQGSNGISIYGYNMVSTGLNLESAQKAGIDVLYTDYEALQKPAFIQDNDPVKLRILYEKETRRIVGAQMASFHDISMGIHMFSLAIQECVTIDRLKLLDIFFLPHFNQPYNYITMAALGAK